jgi:hypothetical protein
MKNVLWCVTPCSLQASEKKVTCPEDQGQQISTKLQRMTLQQTIIYCPQRTSGLGLDSAPKLSLFLFRSKTRRLKLILIYTHLFP